MIIGVTIDLIFMSSSEESGNGVFFSFHRSLPLLYQLFDSLALQFQRSVGRKRKMGSKYKLTAQAVSTFFLFLECCVNFAGNASLLLRKTAMKRMYRFWRNVFLAWSCANDGININLVCSLSIFQKLQRFLSTLNFWRIAKIFISQIKKNTDAYSVTKNIFQIIAI